MQPNRQIISDVQDLKTVFFFVTTWWVLGKHIQWISGNEFFKHETAFILS